ncbi:MAG: flagellar protein FliT, partial [Lachnospiraceae bacterium]|nr:flagellar protein FliT [Lachnospiraceae bacterium]
MDSYLKILEESLRKKLLVLDEIQAYNEKQKQVFQSDSVELDEFDAAVEEKGKLIEQISKLDEGFETLYS